MDGRFEEYYADGTTWARRLSVAVADLALENYHRQRDKAGAKGKSRKRGYGKGPGGGGCGALRA